MKPPRTSASIVLRATLIWCAIITAVLAVIGAILGYVAGGQNGLWSALVGVLLAAFFLGLTAALILFAQRYQGLEKIHVFFGLIIGGLLVKLIVFVVVLFVLRGQPWVDARVFVIAVVVSVVCSLVIDLVVMAKVRAPYVDVELPTSSDAPEEPREPSSGT